MKFAFLLLLLFSPAAGQDHKPRALEPVRVAILTQGEAPHAEALDRLVRDELQKPELRHVVIVSYGARYDVYVTVAEFRDVGCTGFTASLTVKDQRRPKDPPVQSMHTAGSLERLAAKLAKKLEEEYFTKRR